jgi:hypothetical protein
MENTGLPAERTYISVAAELSGVFTPPFLTVPTHNNAAMKTAKCAFGAATAI